MMVWEFELVAGLFAGATDAPCWDGEALLFSVLPEGPVLRFEPGTGKVSEFRRYTHRITGLAFAPDGSLFGCQPSSRRLVRFNADGSTTPMPNLLDGRCQNYPDDLAVDRQGRIWFSDPHSALRAGGPQIHGPLDHASVLRLDLQGGAGHMKRMTYDTVAPRGVALAPNERTLYVADDGTGRGGRRELRAYPIQDDDTLGPYVVLHTFVAAHRGVQGMCLDHAGNVVACAGSSRRGPGPLIYVFDPSGRVLETHPLPGDAPTNGAFGDADLTSLYVTTDGGLYRVRGTELRGHPLFTAHQAAPLDSPGR